MASRKIDILLYHRAQHEDSIETRHSEIMSGMLRVPPPLGWRGMTLPEAPDCGVDLSASFNLQYPLRILKCEGVYIYRGTSYEYKDAKMYDDKLRFSIRLPSDDVDYSNILTSALPEVIKAFQAYLLIVYFDYFINEYHDIHEETYQRLLHTKDLDVDGRNNIFALTPAHYWDAELCQRALGYGPDEVIRRLDGKVPLVRPLMDGVYTVFNDDPNLTFEEFCAINDRFKPILGLA